MLAQTQVLPSHRRILLSEESCLPVARANSLPLPIETLVLLATAISTRILEHLNL